MSKTFNMAGGGSNIRLVSIEITTPPNKTEYQTGEIFDPTGMKVTATYSNGATLLATGWDFTPDGALAKGTSSITVIYTEGGVTAADQQTILVSDYFYDLNENSWEDIKAVSQAHQGPNYWEIGDCKEIELNGDVGDFLTLSGFKACVYIIGFDHNVELEGDGITFGCFMSALKNGYPFGLVDSYPNKTNPASGVRTFNITHETNWHDISSGWKGCDCRYDILGSTDVDRGDATENAAISPVEKTLLAAFPSDLRAVMKAMTVYSNNAVKTSQSSTGVVSASVDFLPFLSEFEIMGELEHAAYEEETYQKQYQYYINGNSTVKYTQEVIEEGTGASKSAYATRSPRASSSLASWAFMTSNNGQVGAYNADRADVSISPIFRV